LAPMLRGLLAWAGGRLRRKGRERGNARNEERRVADRSRGTESVGGEESEGEESAGAPSRECIGPPGTGLKIYRDAGGHDSLEND
jgi:hypothetical protein